jgi:DNA-binding response OmpR family regulator
MTALARVLVVDDEQSVATVLEDFFSSEGYDVRVAHDGPSALAAFDAWHPHVILLDLRMPGMSGVDVFARLRSKDPSIPVVFVTGADDEETAKELLRQGATDYVRKPVDLDYCAQVVLACVGGTGGASWR